MMGKITKSFNLLCHISGHAIIRKWALLSDADDEDEDDVRIFKQELFNIL